MLWVSLTYLVILFLHINTHLGIYLSMYAVR